MLQCTASCRFSKDTLSYLVTLGSGLRGTPSAAKVVSLDPGSDLLEPLNKEYLASSPLRYFSATNDTAVRINTNTRKIHDSKANQLQLRNTVQSETIPTYIFLFSVDLNHDQEQGVQGLSCGFLLFKSQIVKIFGCHVLEQMLRLSPLALHSEQMEKLCSAFWNE